MLKRKKKAVVDSDVGLANAEVKKGMRLVERHTIKSTDDRYKELRSICHLSKNLYNASLYNVRQHFFNTKEYLDFVLNCKQMITTENPDYYALPTKVSQMIMDNVNSNFRSFFGLLKKKLAGSYEGKVNIPRYLEKEGHFVTTFNMQSVSTKYLKEGIIKLSGIEATFKTDKTNIKQVRLVPTTSTVCVEVVYEVPNPEILSANGNVAGIDFGVSNLAVVAGNNFSPIIYKGGLIKSINRFYNKKRAEYTSDLHKRQEKRKAEKKKCRYTSKKITKLSEKRNNLINNILHKASTDIVNHLTKNNTTVLVLGRTKGWKQETELGATNNQNFVNIPHARFLKMIAYKALLKGITVLEKEEAYTSKCSFLDNEPMKKQEEYLGKRIKRGLFKSANGTIINADVNGALNIIRKAVGEFIYLEKAYKFPHIASVSYN